MSRIFSHCTLGRTAAPIRCCLLWCTTSLQSSALEMSWQANPSRIKKSQRPKSRYLNPNEKTSISTYWQHCCLLAIYMISSYISKSRSVERILGLTRRHCVVFEELVGAVDWYDFRRIHMIEHQFDWWNWTGFHCQRPMKAHPTLLTTVLTESLAFDQL